jgi:hypothetical protein
MNENPWSAERLQDHPQEAGWPPAGLDFPKVELAE